MADSLLSTLGLPGAALVIGFIAGMFPLVSIELFLLAVSYKLDSPEILPLLVILGAIGHQIAKTVCFFAGVGALERGPMKKRVDKLRVKIEKWNRYPRVFLLLGAGFGIPPLYVIAFIAEPLMGLRFVPFTAICMFGRLVRYAVIAAFPWVALG